MSRYFLRNEETFVPDTKYSIRKCFSKRFVIFIIYIHMVNSNFCKFYIDLVLHLFAPAYFIAVHSLLQIHSFGARDI